MKHKSHPKHKFGPKHKSRPKRDLKSIMGKLMQGVFSVPILFYRYCVSPFTPASCRHLPTCSEYCLEAIEKNGAWKGSWLALSRLLRCHPWGSHGFDPVPDLRSERHGLAFWRYGRWGRGAIKHDMQSPREDAREL